MSKSQHESIDIEQKRHGSTHNSPGGQDKKRKDLNSIKHPNKLKLKKKT
jgi:hypothetical protein